MKLHHKYTYKIKDVFKTLKIKDYKGIQAIYLSGGWTLRGYLNKTSDIDLIIITNNKTYLKSKELSIYKNFLPFKKPYYFPKSIFDLFFKYGYKHEFEIIPIKSFKNICNKNLCSLKKSIYMYRFYTGPHKETPTSQRIFNGRIIHSKRYLKKYDNICIQDTVIHGIYKNHYYPGCFIDKLLSSQCIYMKNNEIYNHYQTLILQLAKRLYMEYKTLILTDKNWYRKVGIHKALIYTNLLNMEQKNAIIKKNLSIIEDIKNGEKTKFKKDSNSVFGLVDFPRKYKKRLTYEISDNTSTFN